MTWEPVKIVDKYPKDSFTARLEAVGIVDSSQGKPMIELTFEENMTVDLSLGKPGEDRSISGGLALGKFLRSLSVLGVGAEWDVTKDRIVDVRFTPDIVGRELSMVAEKREVTGPKGKVVYVDWTVGSIGDDGPKEGGRTTAPISSHPPGASDDALTGEWKVLLAENLDAGVTYDEGGVVKLLGAWVTDKTRKAALNKARSMAFKTMFAEGFLKGTLSGFTLG